MATFPLKALGNIFASARAPSSVDLPTSWYCAYVLIGFPAAPKFAYPARSGTMIGKPKPTIGYDSAS